MDFSRYNKHCVDFKVHDAATSIGAGACLQAALGAFLVPRFARHPTALQELKDVIKFFIRGGRIDVEIQPERGSTFTFTLPYDIENTGGGPVTQP